LGYIRLELLAASGVDPRVVVGLGNFW